MDAVRSLKPGGGFQYLDDSQTGILAELLFALYWVEVIYWPDAVRSLKLAVRACS